MNACCRVQSHFSDYLDGRLNGRQMQLIAAHLENCHHCAGEWIALRRTQMALGTLGAIAAPEDLYDHICLAVREERERQSLSRLEGLAQAWRQTLAPLLLQAAGGFCSTILLLGTVIVLGSMLAQPERAQAKSDEPLGRATAPRLLYLSSGAGENQIGSAGPVIVQVFVSDSGQMYDYRIIAGPVDEATRSQVENLLLTSRFEPARFFGQPVRGMAVLSFSGISVRG